MFHRALDQNSGRQLPTTPSITDRLHRIQLPVEQIALSIMLGVLGSSVVACSGDFQDTYPNADAGEDSGLDRRRDSGRADTEDDATADSGTYEDSDSDWRNYVDDLAPNTSFSVGEIGNWVYPPTINGLLSYQVSVVPSPDSVEIQHIDPSNFNTDLELGAWEVCVPSSTEDAVQVSEITIDIDSDDWTNRPTLLVEVDNNGRTDLSREVALSRSIYVNLNDSLIIPPGECEQVRIAAREGADLGGRGFIDPSISNVEAIQLSGESAEVRFFNRDNAESSYVPGTLTIFEPTSEINFFPNNPASPVERGTSIFSLGSNIIITPRNGEGNLNEGSIEISTVPAAAVIPATVYWDIINDGGETVSQGSTEVILGAGDNVTLENLPIDLSYGNQFMFNVVAHDVPDDVVSAQEIVHLEFSEGTSVINGENNELFGSSLTHSFSPVQIEDPAHDEIVITARDISVLGGTFLRNNRYLSDFATGNNNEYNCDNPDTEGLYEMCPVGHWILENTINIPDNLAVQLDEFTIKTDSSHYDDLLLYEVHTCLGDLSDTIMRGTLNLNSETTISLNTEIQDFCVTEVRVFPWGAGSPANVQFPPPPTFSIPQGNFSISAHVHLQERTTGIVVQEDIPVLLTVPDENGNSSRFDISTAKYSYPYDFFIVRPEMNINSVFSERISVNVDDDPEEVCFAEFSIENLYEDVMVYGFTFQDPSGKLARTSIPPVLYVNGVAFVLSHRGENGELHYESATGIHVRTGRHINCRLVSEHPDNTYASDDPYMVFLQSITAYAARDVNKENRVSVCSGAQCGTNLNVPGNGVLITGNN